MTIREQVAAFHQKMGIPDPSSPKVPLDDRVRFRIKIIAEEFFELLDATYGPKVFSFMHEAVNAQIEQATLRVDLPDFVDALVDMAVCIEGTHLEFGINSDPMTEAVHQANMLKEPNPQGKQIKPPGWKDPKEAIHKELLRQGWNGVCPVRLSSSEKK
jgi:predicted HAD superfamily Cof-like phosphohydrolase